MLDLVEGDYIFFRNGRIGRISHISTRNKQIHVELAVLNGWNDVMYYDSELILDLDGHQYRDRPSAWDIESLACYKSRFFLDSVWTSKPIQKWGSS